MTINKSRFTLSALALGVATAQPGYAQKLEEVVVTATKRAESMQDVPISMIAMSGDKINEMGITNPADFTAEMPAITIAANPIGNFIFIRGIGTPGANQGMEQSVSIFQDGIYMGRHQLSRAPFLDLARVEVLRGPQSILFGKNTIGGAISVITAKPTEEFEGMVSGLYGWDDDEREVTGVLSGPITDTLRGRLAYRSYTIDGYLDNVMTGKEGPERDDQTLRAQLAWDATDNLSINAKWETSKFDQKETSTQLSVFDPTAGSASVAGLNTALVAAATGGTGAEKWDDKRAVINDGGALLGSVVPTFAGLPGFPDGPEFSNNSMDLGTLTIDWGIGNHTLTAISGYAHYNYRDVCDCDFAALPLISVNATEDYDQWSQEIRLTSPGGEKIDYIVGAYYQYSDLKYRSDEAFGTALAYQQVGVPTVILDPNLTRYYGMNQDQNMWAVFGSMTYSFTDQTRLTAGLRYFVENKTADHFLDKQFTGGWDYSALVGAPPGTIAYGDTPADYDAFLSGFGSVDLGGVTAGQITEGVYAGLLGTFEHDIRKRKHGESEWPWSLTLEHDLTADIMVYGTASSGYKGGGFDGRFLKTNNDPNFEYTQESAMSYELGVKSYLLDGAMTFNATAFYTDVDDFQVSVFDGYTGFYVQNAAQIESKGVEVDIHWAATEGLTISLAGSYLDNEYANWPTAPCWTDTGSDPGNRGDCIGRYNAVPPPRRDASGEANTFSPEWAYNLNFDYRLPLGDYLEARAIVNINYSDEYFNAGDLDPIYAVQDSYTMYDARLSLGSIDGAWEVALLGKNLGDEYVSGNSNDQPLVAGNGFTLTNRLRSYAVQATYRF